MSDHVYKSIELTGSSKVDMEDAVKNAIQKAGQSVRGLHWFQVMDSRGYIENGKVAYWQVTVKVSFKLEE